jgi:hypothetical protein
MNKELFLIVVVIAVIFIVVVYLWGPAPGSSMYTVEGVYVDSSVYKDFPIKGKGEKENENLAFKVDTEKPILLTRKKGEPDPKPGMKATITYQTGRMFNNRVYLDYEWVR